MKAPLIEYVRARSVAQAVETLSVGSDAKILAGGQSLIAALNLRMSSPDLLVDINHIPDLDTIELRDGEVAIGALVRHVQVGASAMIAEHAPLIAKAMEHVAHPAVRNRGTTCGSLAYADPAAEMPACAMTLNATLVLESVSGRRVVSARDFFLGLYETDRRDDEMLVEVQFPAARDDEVFGFGEIARRRGDFPIVGVAARASTEDGVIGGLDLVVFACGPAPYLVEGGHALALGQRWHPSLVAELSEIASREIDPMQNLQGGADVKRRQAKVLVGRVLTTMMEEALAARSG